MKKLRRYIERNWLWIVLGLILTEKAVQAADLQRGYLAYGGEYLTLPLILMLVQLVRNVADFISAALEEEVEYEPRRNRHHRGRVQRTGLRNR